MSPFMWKATIIVGLIVLDIIINSIADYDTLPPSYKKSPRVWIGIQIGIQMVNLIVMLLTLFGTYLFQVGLLGILYRQFRKTILGMLLYSAVYIAYLSYKLALAKKVANHSAEMWDDPVFVFLSLLQKAGVMAYYCIILRALSRLGSPTWYQSAPWVSKFASTKAVTSLPHGPDTTHHAAAFSTATPFPVSTFHRTGNISGPFGRTL